MQRQYIAQRGRIVHAEGRISQGVKSQRGEKGIIRLHEADIKQNKTSSKHRTNIDQVEHTSCACILNAFAGCLLDDCSMFA